METKKDGLFFLNETDFVDKLDNESLEKLVEVKKTMVREFEDCYIPKMIHVLKIIDEIQLSNVINDLDYRLERIESLRSNIFYLISFKHLVDTNNKQGNKQ